MGADRASFDRARPLDEVPSPPQSKFDRVVLLAPRGDAGGTVVYDATPANIPSYFAEGGAPVPTGENPADHLMYVLKDQGGERWAQAWASSTHKQEATVLSEEERKRLEALGLRADVKLPMEQCAYEPGEYSISYWDQYSVLFRRTLHIWIADPQQGPLVMKMLGGIEVAVVLMLVGMPNNLSKANAIFFWIASQLAMCMTPLVIIMPLEKAIILREYRNGVFSATMYWLARFTLALSHAAIVATLTTVFTYPLVGLPTSPFPAKQLRWWTFEFLYLSCVMMLGLTIGTFTKTALGGVKAVIAIQLPWLVTSGILPPLSMIRPALFWMRYPNLYTWATKLALTIGFTRNGEKARQTLVDELMFHVGNANSCYQALGICFGVLFVMGLAATHRTLNKADDSAGQRAAGGKSETLGSADNIQAALPPKPPGALLEAGGTPGSYGATDDVEAPPAAAKSVPIEMRAVTYRHKRSPDNMAINSVSFRVEAGSVTALMGPSGAGKTTLLNLLSGRLPTGTCRTSDGRTQPCLQGQILVDDREAKFDTFRKLGTITPQDEVLSKDLTVRQTLTYTAELRSPKEWTPAQKLKRVEDILGKLGLAEKADNVVGDPLTVGISGGQKKRLSIGIDLLAELPIMLVDEPTTGLDSSAALTVVKTLIALASDQHRTIICTIHQPPWTMVVQFGKLILMALGSLIYDGLPSGLPDFLRAGGSPSPSNENPADYVMDVLIAEGTAKWLALRDKTSDLENDAAQQSAQPAECTRILTDDEFEKLAKSDYAVSQFTQYTILVRRHFYIFVMDEEGFFAALGPSFIVATIIGLAFHNFGVNYYLATGVLMGALTQGMITLNAVTLTIPVERDLILREFRNGTYSVEAYWFARVTISSATAMSIGAAMSVWYSLIGLPARFQPIFHCWLSSSLNAITFSVIGNVSFPQKRDCRLL